MDEDKIIPYIEPILRFCCKRLSNRYDAEDLASEIVCHILDGMNKYHIESFDAWVWRIAHNRYARFINEKSKSQVMLCGDEELADIEDYTDIDEDNTERQYETVFRYLHTLSSEYRNIFVDYYIDELSVKSLAKKYSLPETTIKWRLNVGRKKIRDRVGECKMDKVYGRINWDTTTCNGSMDSDKYLHTQIARAICLAAYEKPVTVEEISISTGIPTMYIEDELPRLEYGDAVRKIGNKYVTDFIIFSLKNRENTEGICSSVVSVLADRFEKLLTDAGKKVRELGFYGSDFGMDRLGYIIVPYMLRKKLYFMQSDKLKLETGLYPPRKDGGYGWFIVEETDDETENLAKYTSGCNIAWSDSTSGHIYYYWVWKYFYNGIYNNKGTRFMCANGIPQNARKGVVSKETITDDDATHLISVNLLKPSGKDYALNFPCFTAAQFEEFISLFNIDDDEAEDILAEWIISVRKSFESFVPRHLYDQINQWVNHYLHQLIGYVIDELISRGVLERPDSEKPHTDGVFYVDGGYINL